MPPKPKPVKNLPPINQWVVDAIKHAGMSQAELSRQMTARKLIGDDRSVAHKIAKGVRDVSADEAIAISEITGYPPLNEAAPEQVIPHLSWVSAGALMRDDVRDEAIGKIRVADLPDGDWIALTVTGDSMDRISPPESVIFIDRRDKRLVNNALYVIDDGEGNATYKRYRPGPPMRFEPVSTNDKHEPIFPEQEPTVVGRVKRSVLDAM